MSTDILVQHGMVIGCVLVGVIARLGLGLIQMIRRRSDISVRASQSSSRVFR